ncbi:hypothetical protein ACOMHN_032090 [Nucella lapillus]
MATLDEVRRLAAEFQRVQLTSAKQKLSERNVVELVNKLVDLKLIEVLYTSDGKEYLTPQHLAKEIRDELTVSGGRINLVDLQQALNVDLSHVEAKVNDLVKHDPSLTLVLGQLIDSSYREKLAAEINDLLQEQGQVTVGEMAQSHDLPPDFVREVVVGGVGAGVIGGQVDSQDSHVVFTHTFVLRVKARIRGAFSALTVPTPVGNIRVKTGCQERLFHSVLDDLLKEGRLQGSVSGGRQDKSVFYPDIYTRAQNHWLDSFYAQNGYLEYDALTRQGLTDVKTTIKRRLKGQGLLMLDSCCVGPLLQDQVTASVDDALTNHTWVDVKTMLPSCLSRQDVSELLSSVLRGQQGAFVCGETVVASQTLVSDSTQLFTDLVREKAEKDIRDNPALLKGDGDKTSAAKMAGLEDAGKEDRKEQRRKKATAGSRKEGTGGREVKTKATKKKGRGREVEEEEEDDGVLQSQNNMADCPPALLKDIAAQLHRLLTRQYQEECRSIFVQTPLTRQYQEECRSIFVQTSGTGTGAERRKAFGQLQDRVASLWTNTHLFLKGIALFQDAHQAALSRHLLKTLCTDITNLLLNAVATDHMVCSSDDTHYTPEARLKLISSLPKDVQAPLSRMHLTLNGQSVEEFLAPMEQLCGSSHVSILLRKPDKRKERQLVFAHRQSLADQLRGESEAALTLHLAVTMLFQTLAQAMVHAPGRLVPALLTHLQHLLDPQVYQQLTHFQDLVVQRLQAEAGGDRDAVDGLTAELDTRAPEVKAVALNTKRRTHTAEDPQAA